MQNLRGKLIPGAPLCEPEYFDGPLSWWNSALPYGGIERQLIATAHYFYDRGCPIRLLCFNIESKYGHDFFLPEARKFCSEVLQFKTDEIDIQQLDKVCGMVTRLLHGADQKFCNIISCLALWLLVMRPQLLHIWPGDCIEILLAAIIADVPYVVISGQSLSPL